MVVVSRRLLTFFCIALLITGCNSIFLPKSYEQAQNYFHNRDYDQAIRYYEKADKEKPNNATIKMGLVKAHSYQAVSLYEEATARSSEDVDKKLEQYDSAQQHRDIAINYLDQAERIQPVDPNKQAPHSRPGQLLLPLNDELDYSAQAKLYRKTLTKHKAYTAEKKSAAQQNQATIVAGLNAAYQKTKNKPDGPAQAYQAFKPYKKYAPYMKKASSYEKAIERNAINFYEARGLHFLSKNKYQAATQDFTAAKEINPASAQAKAGLLSVTAKQQINKKQYEKAYETLNQVKATHNKSKFYAKHMPTVRTQVVDRGLARAKPYTHTASLPEKAKAFDIYYQLQPIAQPSSVLTDKVNNAITRLQDQVANELTARAMVLQSQQRYAYSSNVKALLASAHGFSTTAAAPYKQQAIKANAISEHRRAMPTLYLTRGSQASKQKEFSEWLESELYDNLDNHPIQSISVADPLDLENNGSDINKRNVLSGALPLDHSELVFMLDLKRHSFKESGRTRAKRKSSKYVSSRRMVHNPQWDIAKRKYDEAEELYEIAKIAAEEAYDLCKREASRAASQLGAFGDLAASGLCRYGTNALTSKLTGRDEARDNYYNTPREIEEKVVSRYKYEEYTVSVKGEIYAELSAYDRRNNATYKLEPIKLTVNKSGKIYKKVKPEDVNGLTNGEKGVPDLETEIQRKEQSVLEHVKTQVAIFSEDHQWQRFCSQGETLNKSGYKHGAADAFNQCLAVAPKSAQSSKMLQTAQQAIRDYMGFSPDMINKYGRNKDFDSFGQSKLELDDEELMLASKASTLSFSSRNAISLPKFDMNRAVAAYQAIKKSNNGMPVDMNNVQKAGFTP